MAHQRIPGEYERVRVAGEEVEAFVPHPLPPVDPPLAMDGARGERLRSAEEALRLLNLVGDLVPSLDWFIDGFVRKEAVLSCQIGGARATLVDLLRFESRRKDDPVIGPDVRGVCNCLEALNFARDQLRRDDGLPLSMHLLNRSHARLLQGAREADTLPGEIRRSQNWIGGTRPGTARYVPPPPHRLANLLSEFERPLHEEDGLAPLVWVGLLQAQFELIRPYLDGNGRMGRLLVTLLLEHWGLLHAPLLHPSLFYKRHRDEYHRRLATVRTDGDWEGWTDFFLEAVATVAGEAADTARDLFSLVTRDRDRVQSVAGSSLMAARLFELLPEHPILDIAGAVALLETTRPTAAKAVTVLVEAEVLTEISGRKRGRAFSYGAYLDLLQTGTGLEE